MMLGPVDAAALAPDIDPPLEQVQPMGPPGADVAIAGLIVFPAVAFPIRDG